MHPSNRPLKRIDDRLTFPLEGWSMYTHRSWGQHFSQCWRTPDQTLDGNFRHQNQDQLRFRQGSAIKIIICFSIPSRLVTRRKVCLTASETGSSILFMLVARVEQVLSNLLGMKTIVAMESVNYKLNESISFFQSIDDFKPRFRPARPNGKSGSL